MKASTKELFKFAFSVMEKLNTKGIDVDEAKAQANLIKQANNILRYELDRAVALQKYDNLEIRKIESEV